MQVVLDELLSGRAMQAARKAAVAAQGGSRVTGASRHLARLLPQARTTITCTCDMHMYYHYYYYYYYYYCCCCCYYYYSNYTQARTAAGTAATYAQGNMRITVVDGEVLEGEVSSKQVSTSE